MPEPTAHPDERAFLEDDPELGVQKTDAESRHWERWKNRYRRCVALADRKGGKWLDAASGSGYGAEIIAGVADEVVGVDVDPTTVLYARKHHSRPTISFENRSILDLAGLQEGQFDVVVSIETIEHVADPRPFFQSVKRLMKPGGVFVVSTPESQCGGGPNPLNQYHLHEFTREQLIAELQTLWAKVHLETETAIFSTGVKTVQLYAVCRD